jgi:uncharacterized protein
MGRFPGATIPPTVRRFLLLVLGLGAIGCGGTLGARQQRCVECALRAGAGDADLGRAAARFEQACDTGDARSCSVLGVMYEEGKGVAADPARAERLYERACARGNARACTNLGRLLDGPRHDRDGAAVAFEVACHAGDAEGCYQLGRARYAAGDVRHAAAALCKACTSAHAPACDGLGVLYEQGRGVAQDPTRARDLYRQACEAGYVAACDRLDVPSTRTAGHAAPEL